MLWKYLGINWRGKQDRVLCKWARGYSWAHLVEWTMLWELWSTCRVDLTLPRTHLSCLIRRDGVLDYLCRVQLELRLARQRLSLCAHFWASYQMLSSYAPSKLKEKMPLEEFKFLNVLRGASGLAWWEDTIRGIQISEFKFWFLYIWLLVWFAWVVCFIFKWIHKFNLLVWKEQTHNLARIVLLKVTMLKNYLNIKDIIIN